MKFSDCRGIKHPDADTRHDADVAIVEELLDAHDKWVTEYCTENDDYASGYDCIVDEGSHGWAARIKDWLEDRYADFTGHLDADELAALITDTVDYDLDAVNADINDCDDPWDHADFIKWFCSNLDADELVETIRERLCGSSDCDIIYGSNEYARYTGPGMFLDGFDIGEHEEQIEISSVSEFAILHEDDKLNDVLDDVKSDSYVSRQRRREKNEKTGKYEYTGRETYDPYGSEYPDLLTYHCPGGRWDFVVCEDTYVEWP